MELLQRGGRDETKVIKLPKHLLRFLLLFTGLPDFRGMTMRRLLSILFLLATLRVFGAAGDIQSVVVDTNGWTALITITGVTNKGTYNFGLLKNNGVSAAKFMLTTTELGFDDAGQISALTRTLYGTKQVRGVFPGNATNQENVIGGTNVRIRIALSDFVSSSVTGITATLLSGLYGTNGVISAATNIAVANYSTNSFPKPICNWSRPPFDLITNTTFDVYCVGFGLGAQQQRSLRCVKFWALDEANTSTPTNIATSQLIDWSYGDATPVIEWKGTLNPSGLANSNMLTVHFEAFPWLGTNSLSTADGRYTFPDFECTSTRVFYCTNYPIKIACVANNGIDANGVVVDSTVFNPLSPPAKFLTIGGASRAIANTNRILYSTSTRHDNGGGVIYLDPGDYRISGLTVSGPFTTNLPASWLTVQPFPGVARNRVNITNKNGTLEFGQKIKMQSVTIASQSAPVTFDNVDFIWFDQCDFTTNTTDPRLLDSLTNIYITRSICSAGNVNNGFVQAPSSDTTQFRLIRGNWFTNQLATFFLHPSTLIGNARLSGTNTQLAVLWPLTAGHAPAPYPIIAFNRFLAENSPTMHLIRLAELGTPLFSITNGAAFVQNVVEQASGLTNAARTLSFGSSISSASDTNPVPNFIFWNNTVVGQRGNFLDNAGTPAYDAVRVFASRLNNYCDNINSKDDLDYTPGTRSGNWPIMFSVGASGNVDLNPASMDAGWHWSFSGINTFWYPDGSGGKDWGGTGPSAAWATYAQFVNRASGTCDNVLASGNGLYRVRLTSPLLQIPTTPVLPYDIEGVARNAFDPPGAYGMPQTTILTSCGRLSIPLFGAEVQLCWDTASNAWYQLQSSSVLTTNQWAPLTQWLPGNGSQFCTNDTVLAEEAQRFYRVACTNGPPTP